MPSEASRLRSDEYFLKAKESWEMTTAEKLEQSIIVKEKGTQYFKVCTKHTVIVTVLSLFHIRLCKLFYVSGGKIQTSISTVQKDRVVAGT